MAMKIDYVKWISVGIVGYILWKQLGIREEFSSLSRSTSTPMTTAPGALRNNYFRR